MKGAFARSLSLPNSFKGSSAFTSRLCAVAVSGRQSSAAFTWAGSAIRCSFQHHAPRGDPIESAVAAVHPPQCCYGGRGRRSPKGSPDPVLGELAPASWSAAALCRFQVGRFSDSIFLSAANLEASDRKRQRTGALQRLRPVRHTSTCSSVFQRGCHPTSAL